jgi:hypothetical protein
LAAYPDAIDLRAVLKTDDHDAIEDVVRRLGRSGHEVHGLRRGYLHGLTARNAPWRQLGVRKVNQ